jgi:hypothetical protein
MVLFMRSAVPPIVPPIVPQKAPITGIRQSFQKHTQVRVHLDRTKHP